MSFFNAALSYEKAEEDSYEDKHRRRDSNAWRVQESCEYEVKRKKEYSEHEDSAFWVNSILEHLASAFIRVRQDKEQYSQDSKPS